ncbi:class I SAM-dependent methyltransferase [Gemmatimonas phototrophica]|uniref:Methyltransferase type 11 domain-containing protein n=1 Tax=Gemmatimonas phototrophica TaxID=1379270 RepID=A0A143BMY7_9BACT|nr:methyltransferase domain-containing protein [Gemmatimonas phototrophica]AMW05821.1 hypothetical protein GEMMAAP_15495 [Gemmatimonas phototrophica]
MKYLDRVLQRWRIRVALAHVPHGAEVCDLGTFDGALFVEGANKGIWGVGVDPEIHRTLELPPRVTLVEGYFPDAVDPDRRFDAIVALAVMEHIPPDAQLALLSAIRDRLRPGGLLIMTVPSPLVDWILPVLKFLGLIDGQKLEQHYGMVVLELKSNCTKSTLELKVHSNFQLGLNNILVFRRT